MKKRIILFIIAGLLLTVPAIAVFNEKDISQTLSVLKYELRQEYDRLSSNETLLIEQDRQQHVQMVNMMRTCNELSLMLYSQNQDYTFDMTYALKEVTREYEGFQTRKMPYTEIISHLDGEIDRYSRLIESLRMIPPRLAEVPGLPDSLEYHNDSLIVISAPLGTAHEHHHDESLDRLPMLDSLTANIHRHFFEVDLESQEDRDSCLSYAVALLKIYSEYKDHIVEDDANYEEASERLKEAYDYAQERYRVLQKKMLTKGQDNYLAILKQPGEHIGSAIEELQLKYGRKTGEGDRIQSEWRGPVVTGFIMLVIISLALATIISMLLVTILRKTVKSLQTEEFSRRKKIATLLCGVAVFLVTLALIAALTTNNFIHQAARLLLVYCWMLMAILTSIVIRVPGEKLRPVLSLYMPAVIIGLVVITFRITFTPNRMMNILFFPIMLAVLIWQAAVCKRHSKKAELSDEIAASLTLIAFVVTAVMSCLGYVFLGLLVIIWWLFVLAAIETLIALYRIFHIVRDRRLALKGLTAHQDKASKGEHIRQTWLYDMIGSMILPVIGVAAIPFSVYLALQVFDLQEIFSSFYSVEFFDFTGSKGNAILKISTSMIIVAIGLYFVFRYIKYFAQSMFKDIKFRKIQEQEGNRLIQANEVNLTLANNVISILVWGFYIILLFVLFRIPTGAISVVFAGLATGIGLALKDVLNNFIYGIQLMSGRLRVGDWVECDGVRGKVSAISYQSTQIETLEGAVMSFLNTALFNKNFMNLTRNNPYEFVKIVVGVKYGTDIETVRSVLLKAIQSLDEKDEYGLPVLDPNYGVNVVFDDFGESSVNIAVKQFVLVSRRGVYIAKAKETIYNALTAANIEIPFPQRDIHVVK